MKQETLQKAKSLENRVSEYGRLLQSRNASYHTLSVQISCPYSNDREWYHGRVDIDTWKKMLDVLEEKRQKTMQELESLTDDQREIIADVPEPGMVEVDVPVMSAPSCKTKTKQGWTAHLMRTFDRMFSWILYSITICCLIAVGGWHMQTREVVAVSLLGGLVIGSINNIERVLRELFNGEED